MIKVKLDKLQRQATGAIELAEKALYKLVDTFRMGRQLKRGLSSSKGQLGKVAKAHDAAIGEA